jgi:hypothetical protein
MTMWREGMRRYLEGLDRIGDSSPWLRYSRRKRVALGVLLSVEVAVVLAAIVLLLLGRSARSSGIAWGLAVGVWFWTSIYFLGSVLDPRRAWRAFVRMSIAILVVGVAAFVAFLTLLAR